ncbi:MAG: transposase [Desulfuromonadales bacterium]|nr:transposase [Desulfuromonadales bacterium]
MNRPHSHSLRTGRYDESNRIYLLTTVVADRRPIFLGLTNARICIQGLRHQDETGRTATLAFVLMPDHLHWLIELKSGTLAEIMRSIKSFTARQLNLQQGTIGDVWQHCYHDHALRADEDVRSVARYVVANPVRAGLVKSAWNYPHWDAVWV